MYSAVRLACASH